MWHDNQITALMVALKAISREVDPELLIQRAREQKVALPVSCERVTSPSMGGGIAGKLSFRVEVSRLPELAAAVDRLTGTRRAA